MGVQWTTLHYLENPIGCPLDGPGIRRQTSIYCYILRCHMDKLYMCYDHCICFSFIYLHVIVLSCAEHVLGGCRSP